MDPRKVILFQRVGGDQVIKRAAKGVAKFADMFLSRMASRAIRHFGACGEQSDCHAT